MAMDLPIDLAYLHIQYIKEGYISVTLKSRLENLFKDPVLDKFKKNVFPNGSLNLTKVNDWIQGLVDQARNELGDTNVRHIEARVIRLIGDNIDILY